MTSQFSRNLGGRGNQMMKRIPQISDYEIMTRMGSEATEGDADAMRELLAAKGCDSLLDIDEIDDRTWSAMVEVAMATAAEQQDQEAVEIR